MSEKKYPDGAGGADRGGYGSSNHHTPKHPYSQQLARDPDYFWHWHPSTWPARDRARLERVTGEDLMELRAELDSLKQAFAQLVELVRGVIK